MTINNRCGANMNKRKTMKEALNYKDIQERVRAARVSQKLLPRETTEWREYRPSKAQLEAEARAHELHAPLSWFDKYIGVAHEHKQDGSSQD
jgi:hypothetical protein